MCIRDRYLGDAGSTVLGFLLVCVLIDFSQTETPLIGAVAAGWILGLPLLDASAVIAKRLLERRSPVAPGRDHLHHLLMDSRYSVKATVNILVGCQVVMVGTVLVAEKANFQYTDFVLFWGFIALVALRVCLTPAPHNVISRLAAPERI